MKNQYFGDKRDYFKYDLMISFAEALSGIERFTFIPMLTPNDGSGDGQQTAYRQGGGDAALYKFLRQCATQERRSIIHLRDFLIEQFRFEYCHYHDESYFSHAERGAYFQNVPNEYLQKAVTLVDPDNGLEIRSMRPRTGHKYVRYDEVNKIFLRMSRTSILLSNLSVFPSCTTPALFKEALPGTTLRYSMSIPHGNKRQ